MKNIIKNILHFIGVHRWREMHQKGVYQYMECTWCGKRDYVKIADLYGPLDREWLTRGKIKNLSSEPPTESGLGEMEVYIGKAMKDCKHGLYKIYWFSGGSSLAAIGSLHDGTRWIAPCNWTGKTNPIGKLDDERIPEITSMTLIQENKYDKV